MEPIYYHGVWRMDWGFGNPNLTAAFIATLAVGVWIFAFLYKRGFWIAAPLFSALALCMVHTLSRGGMLGAACGLLPLVFFAPRPWRAARLITVAATLVLAVAALIYFKADDRLVQGVVSEDKSVSNRLLIWQHVPAMMVASAGGWGFGNAASAYEQWFQPLERHERYLHLVSSHLTWLVEISWPLRGAYIAFWIGIFLLMLPSARLPWLVVPFGVWMSFFVSGIFSHVAADWRLWLVPLLFAAAALVGRARQHEWPQKSYLLFCGAGAMSVLLIFALVGALTNSFPAKGTWNCVSLGASAPQTWVLVDRSVFGQNFGRTLRQYADRDPSLSLGLVFDPALIPSIGDKLVYAAGNFTAKDFEILKRARRLVLLNTTLSPRSLKKTDLSSRNIRVLFGDLSQSPAKVDWQEAGFREELLGRGDYLGDWAEVLKAN